MFKFMLVALLSLGLLSGCVRYENGKPVEAETTHEVKKEKTENGTLKEAMKVYKYVKVKVHTDARKTTGHINLVIELDTSIGERSQASTVVSQTDKFIKTLKDKPKTVTVSTLYDGVKILQFTKEVETKKLKIDFAHPKVEDFLRKSGQIK
ncbi:hypothetical protein ABES03_08680 [Neobacillus rhizosphaerae]|uniref:hypothetical protein n=1 Tax=Neobacillus rhizosphaerae TaxID=2880965 RepID=UPI003D28B229